MLTLAPPEDNVKALILLWVCPKNFVIFKQRHSDWHQLSKSFTHDVEKQSVWTSLILF